MFRQSKIATRLALILVILLGVSSMAGAEMAPLEEVRDLVDTYYVDDVDDSVFDANDITELLDNLGDRHTVYFTSEEYQEFVNGINNEFSGIGIYIEAVPEGILVLSEISGTPAAKAGLKSGDIIVEAAGESLEGASTEKAQNLIMGPAGTSVMLKVQREEELLEFNITRQRITVPTVSGELMDNGIGYIKLDSFGLATYFQLKMLMDDLREQGATTWLVDVRNNGGGYLDTAKQIAGLFISDQDVMQWHEKDSVKVHKALRHEKPVSQPVVLLTNQYSASASEILAGALKDHQAATIVGSTTYGKGSVQTMYPLSNNDVLKITVARFTSPQGNVIDNEGISPHYEAGGADALEIGKMLLESARVPLKMEGHYMVVSPAGVFFIPYDKVLSGEYWAEFRAIAKSADNTSIRRLQGYSWEPVSEQELESLWSLYYGGYQELPELEDVAVDKKFKIKTSHTMNLQDVRTGKIELINSVTGKRVPLDFGLENAVTLKATPKHELEEGASYWLVLHSGIQGYGDYVTKQGIIVPVTVTVTE